MVGRMEWDLLNLAPLDPELPCRSYIVLQDVLDSVQSRVTA